MIKYFTVDNKLVSNTPVQTSRPPSFLPLKIQLSTVNCQQSVTGSSHLSQQQQGRRITIYGNVRCEAYRVNFSAMFVRRPLYGSNSTYNVILTPKQGQQLTFHSQRLILLLRASELELSWNNLLP